MKTHLPMSESLESRTFFSATPAQTALFGSAVLADRLSIKAELNQFKADSYSFGASMISDLAAIKADKPSNSSTFLPLVKQFRTDLNKMHAQLFSDRLSESAAALTDEAAILKVRVQMLKDHGNSSALATDRSNLLSDRAQLQNDLIAGLDARIATRQASYSTLSTDIGNIVTAVQADTSASAKFLGDVQKWAGDRTTHLATVSTDLTNLANARGQLAADLAAEQSAT